MVSIEMSALAPIIVFVTIVFGGILLAAVLLQRRP